MKAATNTMLAVLALLFFPMNSASAALIDDLVAYYDFEETGAPGLANKAPGATGTDATWTAAPTNGSTGFSGDAAFNPGDGVSDRSTLLVGNALNVADNDGGDTVRVNVPFSSTTLGSTFTISAWTYLAPGATNASSRFEAFSAKTNYDVDWGTTGNYSTTGRDDYIGFVETTGSGTNFSNLFAEEEWDHVLMVYDTSGPNPTVDIYLNGTITPVTVTDTSGTFSFTSLVFGGARDGASGDRDWDGMIDEVALWDRALTESERTEVYNLGNAGSPIVPEPTSILLLSMMGIGMLFGRKRRKNG